MGFRKNWVSKKIVIRKIRIRKNGIRKIDFGILGGYRSGAGRAKFTTNGGTEQNSTDEKLELPMQIGWTIAQQT